MAKAAEAGRRCGGTGKDCGGPAHFNRTRCRSCMGRGSCCSSTIETPERASNLLQGGKLAVWSSACKQGFGPLKVAGG